MPRARRVDGARNADALLAAARELFAERGPDVPLDDVARRAGVGNATLYRHFPTRSDLLVAVYADEVEMLCERGKALPKELPAGDALLAWLDEFVTHVATKRDLTLAIHETPDGRRTALFDRWHATVTTTAARLLAAAQDEGAVRPGLSAGDLMALTSAAVVASADADHAHRLLRIAWHGLAVSSRSGSPNSVKKGG